MMKERQVEGIKRAKAEGKYKGRVPTAMRQADKVKALVEAEPPHLNWSSAMFRKRRTDNDEQTTEAGRDYHEVEAS